MLEKLQLPSPPKLFRQYAGCEYSGWYMPNVCKCSSNKVIFKNVVKYKKIKNTKIKTELMYQCLGCKMNYKIL